VSENVDDGVEEPMPMFPFARIVKSDVPVEDAMRSGLFPAVPRMVSDDDGVVVPIQTPRKNNSSKWRTVEARIKKLIESMCDSEFH
jgi:succinylarginine dihydrolase